MLQLPRLQQASSQKRLTLLRLLSGTSRLLVRTSLSQSHSRLSRETLPRLRLLTRLPQLLALRAGLTTHPNRQRRKHLPTTVSLRCSTPVAVVDVEGNIRVKDAVDTGAGAAVDPEAVASSVDVAAAVVVTSGALEAASVVLLAASLLLKDVMTISLLLSPWVF
jgi:hypothetical protein